MFDVMIVGAGLSGVLTALNYAEQHPFAKILLIEAASEMLPSNCSSINQTYRLHTGMHYAGDRYTAEYCLIHAIEFARKYPMALAGEDDPRSFLRRGRYYAMSNSLVPLESIREISQHLVSLYQNLIVQDPLNKVFGEPETFIRVLNKEEYPHFAETIPFYPEEGEAQEVSIQLGFESGEAQVDLIRFKAYLQDKIATMPGITCVFSQTVMGIEHDPYHIHYQLHAQSEAGERVTHMGLSIVNCAWQNIEKINHSLGIHNEDEYAVNRLKASVLIQLPESLRHMNSSMCLLGPYMSISVQEDGTAVLTSERTTNIASFKIDTSVNDAEQEQCVRELTLDTEKGRQTANKIVLECASYFKEPWSSALRTSPILMLRTGYVKLMRNDAAYTFSSIYQAGSTIHTRPFNGVQIHRRGLISNSGMKMVYTYGNARQISSSLEKHIALISRMNYLLQKVRDRLKSSHGLKEEEVYRLTQRGRVEIKITTMALAVDIKVKQEQYVRDLAQELVGQSSLLRSRSEGSLASSYSVCPMSPLSLLRPFAIDFCRSSPITPL